MEWRSAIGQHARVFKWQQGGAQDICILKVVRSRGPLRPGEMTPSKLLSESTLGRSIEIKNQVRNVMTTLVQDWINAHRKEQSSR
uniref:Uncharacterized protein n=1 Tax=Physcomitrium patens TaxID=3218 RepID=A0A2K1L9Z4_PHYPA|nr:hypothetical protein PHYPA_001268 [Physcomitrium patens]